MEDRKGLLASSLAGVDIAAFPVDCVDHDSMTNLKRLCARHDVPFVALRTASVTCSQRPFPQRWPTRRTGRRFGRACATVERCAFLNQSVPIITLDALISP
jgi:hypothetical protein